MQCPTCQHEVSGRFCPNCGTDVQALTGAGRPNSSDPNATAVLSREELAAYRERLRSGSTEAGAQQPPEQPVQGTGYGTARVVEPPPGRRRRTGLLVAIVIAVALFALGGVAVLVLSHFNNADRGKVKFGTSYADNGSKFSVEHPRSSFSPTQHVAWVGYLSEGVDATTLRRTITRINPDGSRTVLVNRTVQLSSSTSNKVDQVAADSTVAALEELGVNPPGTYEIAYVSNGKTEAKGQFRLTGSSPSGQVFFGHAATDAMIAGVSQNATFSRADTMNYAAHFVRPAGPGRLTVRIYRIQSDGSQTLVSKGLYDDLKDSGLWVRVNQVAVRDLMGYGANASGTYILGYYRQKDLLAQGKFTLHL